MKKRPAVLAIALAAVGPVGLAQAQGECNAAPLFAGSFESVEGFGLYGSVIGLAEGTAEVRMGSDAADPLQVVDLEDGSFDLQLPSMPPEGMLRVHVRGRGPQAFIELAAHVGSVASLRADMDYGYATLVPLVSPESTVRTAHAMRANGGDIAPGSDCQLAALMATLDPDDAVEQEALLKIAIEDGYAAFVTLDPDAGSPTGGAAGAKGAEVTPSIDTTLQLLADSQALEAQRSRTDPLRLAELTSVVKEDFCSYFHDTVRLQYAKRERNLNAWWAVTHRFDTPTTGIRFRGGKDFTFSCANQVARFDYAGPDYEAWYYRLVDGEYKQVRGIYSSEFEEYRPVDRNAARIIVNTRGRDRLHFPDNPELPDEVFSHSSTANSEIVRAPIGTPLDPAKEPGVYALPIGGVVGDEGETHRVQLSADGTGLWLERNAAASWSLDDDGVLTLEFPDRTATLLSHRDDGPSRDMIGEIEFVDGRTLEVSALVSRREAPPLSVAQVPGNYLQYAGRASVSNFSFSLDSDGTATNTQGRGYGWTLSSNLLTLRSCDLDAGGIPIHSEPGAGECKTYERREFEVLQRHNATLYMLERLDRWTWDRESGYPPDIRQYVLRPYGYQAPQPEEVEPVYVRQILGNLCGSPPDTARLIYYRNTHPTATVRIRVRINWDYHGPREEIKEFILPANPTSVLTPVEGDVEAGCPIPGPTRQVFMYTLLLPAERI